MGTGFCMMVQSMAMIVGNIWGIPFCNARFSLSTTVCVGSIINGTALIAAAFTEHWELSVFCMMWVYLGMSLRGASNTCCPGCDIVWVAVSLEVLLQCSQREPRSICANPRPIVAP